MDKNTAQVSSKKINEQIFSLNPSALIMLFEIDVSDLALQKGLINDFNLENEADLYKFRFHNNAKLQTNDILWQGNKYVASPIATEGFELTSRGVLPLPKLSISVDSRGIELLATLKSKINLFGDIIGAKVTRMRTLAKFLDAENFTDDTAPEGFEPDPYAEFPRDIFHIDRRSNENKYVIEYELTSSFDLQGVKVPNRLVVGKRCPFQYRGTSCAYEYASRKDPIIHEGHDLPEAAPAVANDRNESMIDILGVGLVDKGQWSAYKTYLIGDTAYIIRNGIKYYFVAKKEHDGQQPPNTEYWIADACSKTTLGCKLRWQNIRDGLPFGGFPSVNRIVS